MLQGRPPRRLHRDAPGAHPHPHTAEDAEPKRRQGARLRLPQVRAPVPTRDRRRLSAWPRSQDLPAALQHDPTARGARDAPPPRSPPRSDQRPPDHQVNRARIPATFVTRDRTAKPRTEARAARATSRLVRQAARFYKSGPTDTARPRRRPQRRLGWSPVSTTRIVDIAAMPGAQEADERAAELAWRLPAELAPLARIALDYRWSWDPDGAELFRALDPHAWELHARNPVRQLADLTPHLAEIAASHGPTLERIARLQRVLEDDRLRPETPIEGLGGPVCFVCAEFGVHPSLPIYSGGLGALAGDILKAASDLALPVIGVGLLYRKGYFQQRVDRTGLQHEYWTQIMPERLPTVQVRDDGGGPLTLSFPFFGREVAFHVWRAEVGRVPLYLLDAELEENDPLDRWITARLYEGNPLTRLGQYGLLGLGTVRALRALGIEPGVLHFNEGHPALAELELAA